MTRYAQDARFRLGLPVRLMERDPGQAIPRVDIGGPEPLLSHALAALPVAGQQAKPASGERSGNCLA
jgi:hypothetical protein